MSEVVGAALRDAVRGPRPTDLRAIVAAAGGPAAFARMVRGIKPAAALPAKDTKARQLYENLRRNAARAVKVGGETRHGAKWWQQMTPAQRRRATDAAWAVQEARRWDELAAGGARTRLVGVEVTDETPKPGSTPRTRLRTLPAIGQPGVFLSRTTVGTLRRLVMEPDLEEAGATYVTAFFTGDEHYAWDFEPEVLDVEELRIWPHDQVEGSW